MGKQYTILAVDDDDDVLLVTRMTLESEGYRVVAAADGPTGLEKARTERPDLIVLDLLMPGMSGFEVLEELRRDERTREIPVVVLTVVSERQRTMAVVERGVKYYMVKPFEYDDLVALVGRALAETEGEGSGRAASPPGREPFDRRADGPDAGP